MPIGKRYVESGFLSEEGHEFVLRRDEGGRWRLAISSRLAEPFLGKHVTVDSTREEFDLLHVRKIWRGDTLGKNA